MDKDEALKIVIENCHPEDDIHKIRQWWRNCASDEEIFAEAKFILGEHDEPDAQ